MAVAVKIAGLDVDGLRTSGETSCSAETACAIASRNRNVIRIEVGSSDVGFPVAIEITHGY